MHLSLTIPDHAWEAAVENDRSHLFCNVEVCGRFMSFEAFEVDHPDYPTLRAAHDISRPQHEVTIRGRQYVLFAHACPT